MKKTLLTVSYVLCTLIAIAQSQPVKLTSERKSDKSIEIKYEKTDPGTYTVMLEFSRLENGREPLSAFSVDGYSGTLTTIQPIDPKRGISYRYRYRVRRGHLNPKIDEDFAYVLPYETGTNVMIRETSVVRSSLLGSETDSPGDWTAYRFYTDDQRTVHAARKGIVVSTETSSEEVDPEKARSRNNVYIEHRDGTFARYSGFKPGSIPVKIGQIVFPGDILGENLDTNNRGYNITVIFYQLKIDDIEAGKKFSDTKTRHTFFTPKFLTKSGIDHLQKNRRYTAEINGKIKQKEMSKREIKNYKKK